MNIKKGIIWDKEMIVEDDKINKMNAKNEMIIKKGQKFNYEKANLDKKGKYGIRLTRHTLISNKLVTGDNIESRIIELGYYNGCAKEDFVIEGKFKYLDLEVK
ncbi:MAG: hypothetical protein KKF48_01735 [Nanoarchaeota archaeon]|nr:hypothetical protein [Nanoarchaeota archaeon]MBU1027742.1 hypothetical protein [Nanoarchaeota archaeon]